MCQSTDHVETKQGINIQLIYAECSRTGHQICSKSISCSNPVNLKLIYVSIFELLSERVGCTILLLPGDRYILKAQTTHNH